MAIVAGGFLADGFTRSVKRNRAVITMLSDGWLSKVRILLIRGIRPLYRMSERLLRISMVASIAESTCVILERKGFKSNEPAIVSLLLFVASIASVLAFIISMSPVFGVAIGCIIVIGVAGYVKNNSEKNARSMRESIPEVIRCMQACFKSGQSLLQTLRYTSTEIGGSLGKLFLIAAERLEMGDTTKDALSILRQYRAVPELSFIAVALDVQHQTGGSIVPVLDSARESVEGELELMRSLRVQTAQAKLSATIVTVMPFVLMALFSLMSPNFLVPFFSSWQGFFLLLLALVMQTAGVISVRRMLKIDVM